MIVEHSAKVVELGTYKHDHSVDKYADENDGRLDQDKGFNGEERAGKVTYQSWAVVQTCCMPCSRRQVLEGLLPRSVVSLAGLSAHLSRDVSP